MSWECACICCELAICLSEYTWKVVYFLSVLLWKMRVIQLIMIGTHYSSWSINRILLSFLYCPIQKVIRSSINFRSSINSAKLLSLWILGHIFINRQRTNSDFIEIDILSRFIMVVIGIIAILAFLFKLCDNWWWVKYWWFVFLILILSIYLFIRLV